MGWLCHHFEDFSQQTKPLQDKTNFAILPPQVIKNIMNATIFLEQEWEKSNEARTSPPAKN
jgi:hypothetical protein